MPPIHPAIVHFPIALIIFSVIADVLGVALGVPSLSVVGWWSLFGGAVGMAISAAAGYLDMTRAEMSKEAQARVQTHMFLGIGLFLLVVGLTFWRWMIYSDAAWDLNWLYFAAGLIVVAFTTFQGWLGGEIVYGYGVGVAPTGQGTETAASAKERVRDVLGHAKKA